MINWKYIDGLAKALENIFERVHCKPREWQRRDRLV